MRHAISSTNDTDLDTLVCSAAARRARLIAQVAPSDARRHLVGGGRGHRFPPLRRLERWLAAGQL